MTNTQWWRTAALVALLALAGATQAATDSAKSDATQLQEIPTVPLAKLAPTLAVGDIVFTRIPFAPFTRITEVTGGWSNHVGVVIDVAGNEPVIAESKVPLSTTTPLSSFVRRTGHGRVAVMRPPEPLAPAQQIALRRAVDARLSMLYDTGFNIDSRRQFCSRFAREVLAEATGVAYGERERFSDLLARNPSADQRFWKLWYFGNIPWQRETVTPEAMRRDPRLQPVFDGYAIAAR